MEFMILGTSSGMPTKSRNVSGYGLRKSAVKPWVMIDCGEATQHQVMRMPVSLYHLEAIFITHLHGDHCYGLPGLLSTAAMQSRQRPLTIVAPAEVLTFVNAAVVCSQMELGFELVLVDVTTLAPDFTTEHFAVSVHALSHRTASYAYSFTEREAPFGKPARKVVIAGDNDEPALLKEAVQGASFLLHEATYTQAIAEKIATNPQHSYAAQVAEFAQASALPALVLSHFSARYLDFPTQRQLSLDDIEAEASAHYQGNLFIARDRDIYTLDDAGALSLTQRQRRFR